MQDKVLNTLLTAIEDLHELGKTKDALNLCRKENEQLSQAVHSLRQTFEVLTQQFLGIPVLESQHLETIHKFVDENFVRKEQLAQAVGEALAVNVEEYPVSRLLDIVANWTPRSLHLGPMSKALGIPEDSNLVDVLTAINDLREAQGVKSSGLSIAEPAKVTMNGPVKVKGFQPADGVVFEPQA